MTTFATVSMYAVGGWDTGIRGRDFDELIYASAIAALFRCCGSKYSD